MTDFKKHDIDSAPEESKPFLENSQKNTGMIPGLHGVMADLQFSFAPSRLLRYR